MFADQSFSHQMIISLILTTSSVVYILILSGENRLWSLLGLKGLNWLCPQDIAVLGQFCAEVITWCLNPYTECSCRKRIS